MIVSIFFVFALFFQSGELVRLPSKVQVGGDNEINLEIVGGSSAKHGQFPYQIYMFVFSDPDNNMGSVCGGTILNERTILTAAHCVVDKEENMIYAPSSIEVFTGIEDKSKAYMGTGIKASDVSVHPDYRVQAPDSHDDIAIVTLSEDIEFGNGVNRACLDITEKQYPYYIISGFGQTRGPVSTRDSQPKTLDPGSDSNYLKFAYVKEDKSNCDTIKHICTVSYNSNKITDTCHGDSGSGLSTPNGKVAGVVSTGNYVNIDANRKTECLGRSQFTRVSRFLPYIDQVVGKDNYCT